MKGYMTIAEEYNDMVLKVSKQEEYIGLIYDPKMRKKLSHLHSILFGK